MASTEAEAKTKWCPLARAAEPWRWARQEIEAQPIAAVNRGSDSLTDASEQPHVMCIGSACMAWRWSRAKETKAYLDAVQAHMKATGENFNVATNKVWAELGSTFEQTEGYCGQFGKPE